MRNVVRSAFYDFNTPMEGEIAHLYQDVKGLVSVGVGILCDPMGLVLGLPFVHPDGSLATRGELIAEWQRIKELPPNAKGQTAAQLGHLYAKPHTRLRLTKEGLRSTMLAKLEQNDLFLLRRFPQFEEWPADAQLATHSLAWACGPAFRFPLLAAALQRQDFTVAAVECFMPEEKTISGLRPRNKANRLLYRNAAYVRAHSLDPAVLHWPHEASDTSDEEVTQPSFPIVHASPFQEPDDEPPAAA